MNFGQLLQMKKMKFVSSPRRAHSFKKKEKKKKKKGEKKEKKNIEIRERCKGVHCADLGESFPTSRYTCKNRRRYSRERATRSLAENSIHFSFASLQPPRAISTLLLRIHASTSGRIRLQKSNVITEGRRSARNQRRKSQVSASSPERSNVSSSTVVSPSCHCDAAARVVVNLRSKILRVRSCPSIAEMRSSASGTTGATGRSIAIGARGSPAATDGGAGNRGSTRGEAARGGAGNRGSTRGETARGDARRGDLSKE